MNKKRKRIIVAFLMVVALVSVSCTKVDEECDYKTNTSPKGIIIVNPDKIVK